MTDRNRWIALYVLCAGMLMIVLDVTVVNVALPSIQNDLGFSQSSLAWVVNAYLISFGGLLLLAGRFGDLIGRKNVFMAGLAVFTLASLLCGVAQSQGMLVVARFVQGIGGAMTSAVILGMIVTMFPEPREQAKAIGVYGVRRLRRRLGRPAGRRRADPVDQLALDLLHQRPDRHRHRRAGHAAARARRGHRLRRGRRHPRRGADHQLADARRLHDRQARGRARLGLGRGARLWAPSRSRCSWPSSSARPRPRNPLIPLRIFRSRNVSGANVIQALTVAGMFGMFFLGSLYLQRVLGYDALEIGLAFLPAHARHGRAVAALLRAADHALRRAQRCCSPAWC